MDCKIFKKIVLFILSLSLIAGYSIQANSTDIGNTGGNLVLENGGWVVNNGDKIYYLSAYKDKNDTSVYVYRLNMLDSKGQTSLLVDKLSIPLFPLFNYFDGNIFFTNAYKVLNQINISKKEVVRVSNEYKFCSQPFVYGKWIYYNKTLKGYSNVFWGQPARMSLDGSETEILDSDMGAILGIDNDWVYYQISKEKTNKKPVGYYKMKLDGSKKAEMKNVQRLSYENFVDDWIYYQDNLDNVMYKIRTDGSKKTKLLKGKFSYINVNNGWIYYSDEANKNRLCKIKTDGTKKTSFNIYNCKNIQIVGDWIFYIGENFDLRYKLKTDGTQKSALK